MADQVTLNITDSIPNKNAGITDNDQIIKAVFNKPQTIAKIDEKLQGLTSGWSEVSEFEDYDDKILKKIVNYVGGTGEIPLVLAERIGKYFAETGLTNDKDLALNFYSEVTTDVSKSLKNFIKKEVTEWVEINPITDSINYYDNVIVNSSFTLETKPDYAAFTISKSTLGLGFTKIKIVGNLDVGIGNILWLGVFDDATSYYRTRQVGQLLTELVFNIDEVDAVHNIDPALWNSMYLSMLKSDYKIYKGKTTIEETVEDSVKKYIDAKSSDGLKISNLTKAQIETPKNLVRVSFDTTEILPTITGIKINGKYTFDAFNGTSFTKWGTLAVQGSSSAVYPKKNWTFEFFNDEAKTSKFLLRIGNWVFQESFVFKSNYIDATQSRNIVCNKIWEQIIQSRKTFPKRGNEQIYQEGNASISDRFDSGALCHVDGFPAELYVNGEFYGLGTFNLGKKRENYDQISTNQNHIQIAAETHANLEVYAPAEWEIRNPKTPDGNFLTKINTWFASNALTGVDFKTAFPITHDLRNAIDFYLLAEFIQALDMYDKNFILTSWNGVKFSFMPYDMDSVFGLSWEGLEIYGYDISIRNVPLFQKMFEAYPEEIKSRYAELKALDILTESNVYYQFSEFSKVFGVEKYKQDFLKWTEIPSNNVGITHAYGTGGCYTSVAQVIEWTRNRITWLNTQYV